MMCFENISVCVVLSVSQSSVLDDHGLHVLIHCSRQEHLRSLPGLRVSQSAAENEFEVSKAHKCNCFSKLSLGIAICVSVGD